MIRHNNKLRVVTVGSNVMVLTLSIHGSRVYQSQSRRLARVTLLRKQCFTGANGASQSTTKLLYTSLVAKLVPPCQHDLGMENLINTQKIYLFDTFKSDAYNKCTKDK